MITLQVAKGLLTYVPGLYSLLRRRKMGGSTSAEYCYEVWIKHITFLHEAGLREIPLSVAELGPGDTIGVGLCALLSGAERYTGLDVYPYSHVDTDLECFDALVRLFEARAPCTGPSWPDYQEYLDDRSFPSEILTEELLQKTLHPDRIRRIRDQIKGQTEVSGTGEYGELSISYVVPWHEEKNIRPGSVDLIISHSVLEHVADIDHTVRACNSWLRPGGWMSHQVDFSSHDLTDEWNGHWSISDFTWKLIMGRRQFFINREPVSVLENAFDQQSFEVMRRKQRNKSNSVDRTKLSKRFREMSDADFDCAELMIQLRKPTSAP